MHLVIKLYSYIALHIFKKVGRRGQTYSQKTWHYLHPRILLNLIKIGLSTTLWKEAKIFKCLTQPINALWQKKWKIMEVTWATHWPLHKDSGSCYWIELNHLNILFVMSLSTYKASGIWKRSMSFHHFVSRQASNCKIHKQSLWNMYYKCFKISNHLQTFMHNPALLLLKNISEKKFLYYYNNKHCESIA